MREQLLKIANRVIAREVEKNAKAGPPPCYGILHQPMRAERTVTTKNTNEKGDE